MKDKSDLSEIIRLQDVMVNKDFLPILEENHLTSFPSLMNYPGGQVVKKLIPARSTVSFELKSGKQVVNVFLKRYHPLPIVERIISPLSLFLPYTALREWENIRMFHRVHLPTVTPVAAGMKQRGIFSRESFLLTKGLEGTIRLEDLIPEHFAPPLPPEVFLEKRALIRQLALLTQKMHNSGFNHRDFYLCHILARKDGAQAWELFICDLHRVDRRKKVGMRWRVKDLAALNYSAPGKLVSARDRICFLKQYLNRENLDHEARSFIMKIVRRTTRMKRHNVKRTHAGPENLPAGIVR